MSLVFLRTTDKSYTFQISQVPVKSKDDNRYWNNLTKVKNNNITSTSSRDKYILMGRTQKRYELYLNDSS